MFVDVETSRMTLPLVLGGGPFFATMSRDDFFDLCQSNRPLRIERTADGDLVIMTPTGGETGRRNMELAIQIGQWSRTNGTGIAFDSSTGYWLPNGAARSPDASWLLRERWDALTPAERKKFPPLAPDFVVELRSEADRPASLREKMQEYVDNGVRLAWLIDPIAKRVEVYRPGQAPTMLDAPTSVGGDPELPGFTLDLTNIW